MERWTQALKAVMSLLYGMAQAATRAAPSLLDGVVKVASMAGPAAGKSSGRPLAFVLLAFIVGATVSQASFAFADDSSTNPFRAIWDAISELQVKTDSLQAQIDDLRAERGLAAVEAVATKVSEPSIALEVGNGQVGQTIITVVARNSGPENAVGVKISTYYQMSLFHVNFIEGAQCTDQSRGIIECYIGTIEAGSEARIAIDATPSQLGQQAIIVTDIASITDDANHANNHAEAVFITSNAVVVQTPVAPAQPAEVPQAPAEEVPAEAPTEQPPAETPAEQPPSEQQSGEQKADQSQSGEQQSGEQAQSGEQSSSEQSSSEASSSSTESSGEESSSSSGEQGSGGDTGGSGEAPPSTG